MRAILVVLAFPPPEFPSKIFLMSEISASVEFLGIGLMASFHLPVDLRASGRNVAMRDTEIREMPSELGAKRGVVVGLDPLDSKREMFSDFLQEVHRRPGIVVIVDA
jgi:hypothetical protein